MLKSRWSVFLDEEVRDPGAAVAGNQAQSKQPPSASRDGIDGPGQTSRGAEQMQQSRARPAVLGDVKRPELGEGIESYLAHRWMRVLFGN